MATETDITVGLDIGTTKICAIVGHRNEYGKLDILGVGKSKSIGVERGVVVNIDQTVRSIQTAVEEASQASNVQISDVHVGIAGQHIRSFQHRGSIVRRSNEQEIGDEDLDRLIDDMYKVATHPGEKIIHVLPQEYTVDQDYGIKHPKGMFGTTLEGNFHIITGQITAIKNIYRCVEKAGYNVVGMTLEPIASAEAVLSEDEKEAGVALVDIGGGTTDVAIFKEGIIRHTAVIALGGNIITRDIQHGCTILQKQAEALKLQYGCALADFAKHNEVITIPALAGRDPKEISKRNLAHIIQARVEEIFEHVMFQIKSSGYKNALIGGIVLTGGGAMLEHISHLVEYATGQDARVGFPTEHLGKGITENIKNPQFATGIGLVAHADRAAQEQQNQLVPSMDHAKKKASRKPEGFIKSLFQKGMQWLNDDNVGDFNDKKSWYGIY